MWNRNGRSGLSLEYGDIFPGQEGELKQNWERKASESGGWREIRSSKMQMNHLGSCHSVGPSELGWG